MSRKHSAPGSRALQFDQRSEPFCFRALIDQIRRHQIFDSVPHRLVNRQFMIRLASRPQIQQNFSQFRPWPSTFSGIYKQPISVSHPMFRILFR